MSTYLYDEALVDKISNWTKDTQMTIYGPDEVDRLFTVVADTNGDKPIKLPMIAISKLPSYEIRSTVKRPLSYDGLSDNGTSEGKTVLNAIPVKLSYQIDIITRHYAEADEYCRNFIFNIINYPKIVVNIPYLNKNLKHESSITLDPIVENSSGMSIRQVAGQLYRHVVKITIEDAYLFDIRVKNYVSIDPGVFVDDNGVLHRC